MKKKMNEESERVICLPGSTFDLTYHIHLNAIEAMREPALNALGAKNTAYWDAQRVRLSKLAIDLYGNDMPRLVKHFLDNHIKDETKHAKHAHERDPIADRVFALIERCLREHGLASYFAMILMEERRALAQALLEPSENDPHEGPEEALDEFYHASTPTILIPLLKASTGELVQAVKDQEEFFRLLEVPIPKSPWGPYFIEQLVKG
jgi:hypothetical protein